MSIARRMVTLASVVILGLLAMIAVPAMAQAARAPRVQVVELRDECEPVSWNAEFPGLCSRPAGTVTLARFRDALKSGGHHSWWIRQRDLTLKREDPISATNVGGIIHTFTEVNEYGRGCVAEWNQAVPASSPDNCDFGKFINTLVVQGGTSAPQPTALGVHKFQCLVHPWMRTTVTTVK